MKDNELILMCRTTAQWLDRIACELDRREANKHSYGFDIGKYLKPFKVKQPQATPEPAARHPRRPASLKAQRHPASFGRSQRKSRP